MPETGIWYISPARTLLVAENPAIKEFLAVFIPESIPWVLLREKSINPLPCAAEKHLAAFDAINVGNPMAFKTKVSTNWDSITGAVISSIGSFLKNIDPSGRA